MSKSPQTPDDETRPSFEEGSPEELDQQIFDLPSREALSVVDPGVFGVGIPFPLGRTADAPPAAPGSADPSEPIT